MATFWEGNRKGEEISNVVNNTEEHPQCRNITLKDKTAYLWENHESRLKERSSIA